MTDDDHLDIPEFLRRQKDGSLSPSVQPQPSQVARPAPPKVSPMPEAEPVAVVQTIAPSEVAERAERRKLAKQSKRLGNMKANLEMKSIPPAFRRWDQRTSKWYDSRIVDRQKLLAAAARLGIKLENTEMEKFTILAYNKDTIIERGRTSLPATASDFEVQAKLQAAAKRAGLRKIDKLEVINPDGTVAETWTVDFENKMLHKSGAELSIPATAPQPEGEQETTEMASTAKKKSTAKKAAKKKATSNARKAAGNGSGKPRGVGVIATIIDTIKRDRGASQDEIVAVLVKKFPDRGEDAMRATVKIQANKNAKKKDKDDKRGLVYYG
jgi:hypothetical protein